MLNQETHLSESSTDHAALTAIRDRVLGLRHSRVALAVYFGLTTVAVIAQPYGTSGELDLGLRVLFWSVLIAISMICGAAFDEISYRIVQPLVRWRAALVASVLMTLVFAPMVFVWSRVIGLLGGGLDPQFWSLLLNTFVPTLTVYSVIHVLRPHLRDGAADTGAAPEPEPLPRLVQRLDRPRATIYRLSANDHLTDVATDQGLEQIRMRFADAVEEMAPLAGCHVHRSHWVPLEAVETVQRRGGKVLVTLVNGDELPVSRTYRPRLEAARPDLF
ncbi:LytTR family DNA-binding domain-containing protein [Marinovum sp.]|uniref:LytTR family DNA-binding domain-containing protein n=1 Tax=Marinovum sp. TaxID=2024839 RepID=UPI002B26E6BB|nr:LytTR family DNA-binding domain-containing protein [Marinovum sp.]